MTKTLTRLGNSYALVIDKPIMDLLGIAPETPLEITTDGKTLVLTPVTDVKRKARFDEALKRTNRKFGKALKNLAK